MANLGTTFDANSVEPNAPRELLPPGDYLVQFVRSEMKPTKSGAGQYLELEADILEGQHTGRKLFDRLNLVNPNAQAVEIARRSLSAICRAIGEMEVSDSERLHFKPLVARVAVRPAREEYGPTNEVKGYLPAGGATTTAVHRPVTVAAPAAKPAASTPPWRKAASA
ncbi:MAG: hypothetical protein NVS1B6_15790 [Steroidobacteraceae bacterium]